MKKLIQKLQVLIDVLPKGINRANLAKDILKLKLSKTNEFYLTIKNKYNV
jgi:hypothetical protein